MSRKFASLMFQIFHRKALSSSYSQLSECMFAKTNWNTHEIVSRNFSTTQVFNVNVYKLNRPDPTKTKRNLRYKVNYPEDGKYTIEPLTTTKLGGRDPETGRIIYGCVGGGIKKPFLWLDLFRRGPDDGSTIVDKVYDIMFDMNKTPYVALIGHDTNLRYILATENMRVGDLIKTSSHVPRIPIRPKEGDAHPLGALPFGTLINSIEMLPRQGAKFVMTAGTCGTVLRAHKDKVVVQLPSKRLVALDKTCMACVGRLSNIEHNKLHYGSMNLKRRLGIRPRSGLWQRKDGYKGRKIRPLPPMKVYNELKPKPEFIQLKLASEEPRKVVACTRRVS